MDAVLRVSRAFSAWFVEEKGTRAASLRSLPFALMSRPFGASALGYLGWQQTLRSVA